MYISSITDEWFFSEKEYSKKKDFSKLFSEIIVNEDIYILEAVPSTINGKLTESDTPYYLSSYCYLKEHNLHEHMIFHGLIEVKCLEENGEEKVVHTICDTNNQRKWVDELWKLKRLYQQTYLSSDAI